MYLPAKVIVKSNTQESGKLTTPPCLSLPTHFQDFLGLEMTRATRFLRGLASTLAGLPKNSAGHFYLPAIKSKAPLTSAANTDQRLTKADPPGGGQTMANKNILLPGDSGNPETFNLQLSADIDEARYNVELLKQSIIDNAQSLLYWEARLKTLENQIPEIQSHLIGQLKDVLAHFK